VSVVVTLAFPQYVEPDEIPGHLDDAYQFAYAVASPEHGDYHGHQQSRDENGFTSGSYYLLGADGQWSQTIFADKGAGYQALYNQRPAGAPPPQVSEVSYQIFVHPGATAISAQGGVPAAPSAPEPLAPFGGIQQKSFSNPQLQNNQINQQPQRFNQAQVRQPVPRFQRETQVAESTQPQRINNVQVRQPAPRFQREIQEPASTIQVQQVQQVQQPARSARINSDSQFSESAPPVTVIDPITNSKVVMVKVSPDSLPKSARSLDIPANLQSSPSTSSNLVMVRALPQRRPQRPTSIFTTPIATLLRRFQPRPQLAPRH